MAALLHPLWRRRWRRVGERESIRREERENSLPRPTIAEQISSMAGCSETAAPTRPIRPPFPPIFSIASMIEGDGDVR
jgi:hypothetical protein